MLIVVACCLLIVDFCLLLADCWLLIVDCWLLIVDCWLLIVDCWLLIVDCWLLIVDCWLLFDVDCCCCCCVVLLVVVLLNGRARCPISEPRLEVQDGVHRHGEVRLEGKGRDVINQLFDTNKTRIKKKTGCDLFLGLDMAATVQKNKSLIKQLQSEI